MGKHHIPLNDIPRDGRHISADDQTIWSEPLQEFHMQCQIVDPVLAQLDLMSMPGGVMVRGTLTGSIELPCNRCAEPMLIALNADIERFESSPDMPLGYDEDDAEGDFFEEEAASHIVMENATPCLDLAALCWEEFMLAFPLRPVCSGDCKGLCTVCGCNLNEETCLCTQDSGDARLAVLRTLKIKNVE